MIRVVGELSVRYTNGNSIVPPFFAGYTGKTVSRFLDVLFLFGNLDGGRRFFVGDKEIEILVTGSTAVREVGSGMGGLLL